MRFMLASIIGCILIEFQKEQRLREDVRDMDCYGNCSSAWVDFVGLKLCNQPLYIELGWVLFLYIAVFTVFFVGS